MLQVSRPGAGRMTISIIRMILPYFTEISLQYKMHTVQRFFSSDLSLNWLLGFLTLCPDCRTVVVPTVGPHDGLPCSECQVKPEQSVAELTAATLCYVFPGADFLAELNQFGQTSYSG